MSEPLAWLAHLIMQQGTICIMQQGTISLWRLRENQYVVREGYETWTIATIARHLNKGQKTILKSACRLGQNGQAPSPPYGS